MSIFLIQEDPRAAALLRSTGKADWLVHVEGDRRQINPKHFDSHAEAKAFYSEFRERIDKAVSKLPGAGAVEVCNFTNKGDYGLSVHANGYSQGSMSVRSYVEDGQVKTSVKITDDCDIAGRE